MKKTETPQQRLQRTSRSRQYQLQKVPKMFNQLLAFMEYNIRKQFRTFTLLSICGSEKSKFLIDKQFESSYNSLSIQQKLFYFQMAVQHGIQSLKEGNSSITIDKDQNKPKQKQQFNIVLHQGFRSTHQIKVIIDGFKISSKNQFSIDAQNYIIRKSNKTDVKCFVLLAIRQSNPITIRFSFPSEKEFQLNHPKIQTVIYKAYQLSIKRMAYKDQQSLNKQLMKSPSIPQKNILSSYGRPRQTRKQIKQQTPISISKQQIKSVLQFSKYLQQSKSNSKNKLDISIVQDLMKPKQDLKFQNEQVNSNNVLNQLEVEDEPFDTNQQNNQHNFKSNQLSQKNNVGGSLSNFQNAYKNVFYLILPDFNLNEIKNFRNYTQIYHNDKANLTIFNHDNRKERFKLKMIFNQKQIDICKILIDSDFTKKWNSEVDESQVKQLITSQNSLICYQKHHRCSKLFKERDYLFLRHVFQLKNSTYIVDRSIQHECFIPFQSIQRGQIKHCVYQIFQQKEKTHLIMDIFIDHGGLMTLQMKSQLTLNYLIGFSQFQRYVDKQKYLYNKRLVNLTWCIDSTLENTYKSQVSIKTQDFLQGSEISDGGLHIQDIQINEDEFYSINQNTQTQDLIEQYQIQPKQSSFNQKKQTNDLSFLQHRQQIQVDQNGLSILPKTYLIKKHPINPIQDRKFPRIQLKYSSGSIVLKDDFIQDKTDGIKLVNQTKIAAQDNVIKFIMKTMKKNLFSGKSILSISLPVQIFRDDSNLQRYCQSMTLGPHFLQKAAATNDILQRMKLAICFGLSNSIIYFYMQKPFNPILGQTFQGLINGCPIYAQQISHHPPITSLYFVGRGYKITANIQSKVYIHLNSGDGVNHGYYYIHFDDGHKIKFQTAPGQVSGFTIGDRKYKYKDRMYVIDQTNHLYSQLCFEDFNSGFFSKSSWKYTDQMEGKIYKVSQKFLEKFNSSQDKIHPKEKDIEQTLCSYDGRWLFYLNFEGVTYYKINQDLPYQLMDYEYPLNSNSRYREDLLYRVKNDLARSQMQKERLQIIQRNDRKLRQKYHKSH